MADHMYRIDVKHAKEVCDRAESQIATESGEICYAKITPLY